MVGIDSPDRGSLKKKKRPTTCQIFLLIANGHVRYGERVGAGCVATAVRSKGGSKAVVVIKSLTRLTRYEKRSTSILDITRRLSVVIGANSRRDKSGRRMGCWPLKVKKIWCAAVSRVEGGSTSPSRLS